MSETLKRLLVHVDKEIGKDAHPGLQHKVAIEFICSEIDNLRAEMKQVLDNKTEKGLK